MTKNNGSEARVRPGRDLLASIVVFLVALPLCMGIAIASGVPVAAGLITGIVGGLIVGPLAGAPLQVSGPAAGMTVIVLAFVQEHGFAMLGTVVLLAGAMQLAAAAVGGGQWFRAVSPAVVRGMLAGIGILILGSQFHVMVDDEPKGSGWKNLVTIPEAVAKGLHWNPLGTTEERSFRVSKLKQIATLHKRQLTIQANVEEVTSAATSVTAQDRQRLADQQAQLTSELSALIQDLEAYPVRSEQGTFHPRVHEASQQALMASREAEQALEQGSAYDLLPAQGRASHQLKQLLGQVKSHDWAAKIGLLTIAVILLWQTFSPKFLRLIPGPLLAVVVATVIAALTTLPVLYVEVPERLLDGLQYPSWQLLMGANWTAILTAAAVFAAVASAETLLCAAAVDRMHTGPRTNYDRELMAQGIGNMTCGLLGALPMTGVIVRSSANVHAGATSRLSAILHGMWLLAFVALLPGLLSRIPTASLAAILVYTGYKLADWKVLRDLAKYGKSEAAIFLITATMIVATDLLTGVIAGLAASAAKLLYVFSHLEVKVDVVSETRANLRMKGTATFVRLPKLATALEKVPAGAELHVDFHELRYIDHACLDLLMTWAKQHESLGGRLYIDWDSLHARFRSEMPEGAKAEKQAQPVDAPKRPSREEVASR